MRVDCALLSDAATVREGLLFIIGGGITRVYRPTVPTPLGSTLALRIMVHPTEASSAHKLEAILLREDGQQTAKVEAQFGIANPGKVAPGEELSVAIAIPLQQVGLANWGGYSFEVLIDGIHQASVPFVLEERHQ